MGMSMHLRAVHTGAGVPGSMGLEGKGQKLWKDVKQARMSSMPLVVVGGCVCMCVCVCACVRARVHVH